MSMIYIRVLMLLSLEFRGALAAPLLNLIATWRLRLGLGFITYLNAIDIISIKPTPLMSMAVCHLLDHNSKLCYIVCDCDCDCDCDFRR